MERARVVRFEAERGARPPAVETAGLGQRYGRRWALVNVTLSVPAGTVAMVTGRNGSGKSTLLKVLATALRPDKGAARVGGHDVVAEKEAVRHQVALLAHHGHLYEALTPLENLRLAAGFLGRDASRTALLPLLAEVGLEERADDRVATLSAGMRRRLALARTLLQEPAVALLDEPYGQLDPPGFRLVDRVLARLRARGATVLMATHLLERGVALCDQVLFLEEGRLMWSGPAVDFSDSPRLASAESRGRA